MAETTKATEDPNFKGGAMSPNSQQSFAGKTEVLRLISFHSTAENRKKEK